MDGLSHLAPRPDQMPQTPVMRQHIDHASAWKVADFRSPADYSIDLTAGQLADIEFVREGDSRRRPRARGRREEAFPPADHGRDHRGDSP